MATGHVAALVTLLAFAPGEGHSPIQWSPDGRWIAYAMISRSPDAEPGVSWIFPASSAATSPAVPMPGIVAYKIVTTELESGRSVTVLTSREPVTSPSWRPDGGALAFGRLVRPSKGGPRLEIVVQESVARSATLAALELEENTQLGASLLESWPVWSPDGRHVAIQKPGTDGLVVIRSDNGRIIKQVAEGRWPAWSLDGQRIALVRGREDDVLVWVDLTAGSEHDLATVGTMFQAPVWSRDGRSIQVVSRRKTLGGKASFAMTLLSRVQVETGAVETTSRLSTDPLVESGASRTTTFALSEDGEDLFHVQDLEGQPASLVWFRPRNSETYNRDHPIDFTIRLGRPSLSPTGKWIALRFGPPALGSPVGLWELGARRFLPVVPDGEARMAWLELLGSTTQGLLRVGTPTAVVDGKPVERPTLLPIPGEIPSNQELSLRLRRIGGIGAQLCEGLASTEAHSEAESKRILEARLGFDSIREAYPRALASLDALDSIETAPEERLRLLSVRAQIFLGMGDPQRASGAIACLQEAESRAPRVIEETPLGFRLGPPVGVSVGWAAYLARRAEALNVERGIPRGSASASTVDHLSTTPAPSPNPGGPGGGFPRPRLP